MGLLSVIDLYRGIEYHILLSTNDYIRITRYKNKMEYNVTNGVKFLESYFGDVYKEDFKDKVLSMPYVMFSDKLDDKLFSDIIIRDFKFMPTQLKEVLYYSLELGSDDDVKLVTSILNDGEYNVKLLEELLKLNKNVERDIKLAREIAKIYGIKIKSSIL